LVIAEDGTFFYTELSGFDIRRQQFWRQNQLVGGWGSQPIVDTAGDGGDLYPIRLRCQEPVP